MGLDVVGPVAGKHALVLGAGSTGTLTAKTLPTSDPVAVQNCRDKHQTRVLLEAAEVPQPISLAADTLEEARQVVDRTGFPAVIKPRGYGGSFGVVRVDGPEDLTEHFMSTRSTTDPHGPVYETPVLVEEYLDGPEISVDSVIRDGKVTPLFVARKVIAYPPYFEEIGHYLDAGDGRHALGRRWTCPGAVGAVAVVRGPADPAR